MSMIKQILAIVVAVCALAIGASAQARYLQSDPIGLKGGANTYAYFMQVRVDSTHLAMDSITVEKPWHQHQHGGTSCETDPCHRSDLAKC